VREQGGKSFFGATRGSYVQCGFCEHINATGPGPATASNPAGERDPSTWGWIAREESAFGYVRLETSSADELTLEFVRSFDIEHKATTDARGRSLHLERGERAGCKMECVGRGEGRVDGSVSDRVVMRRSG